MVERVTSVCLILLSLPTLMQNHFFRSGKSRILTPVEQGILKYRTKMMKHPKLCSRFLQLYFCISLPVILWEKMVLPFVKKIDAQLWGW